MQEKFYKPSNQFTALGFILLVVSTAAVGTLLSYPYLLIVKMCRYVAINIFIAMFFGIALGLVANYFIKILKLRNPVLAGISTFVGGMIFTYFKWAFYLSVLTEQSISYSFKKVIGDPKGLWVFIEAVNEQGTWGLGHYATSNVTGPLLWIVWVVEAAMLVGIPMILAVVRSREPFIENENEWAREYKKGVFLFEYFNVTAYKPMLVQNPYNLFNVRNIAFVPKNGNYVNVSLLHSFDFTENYISVIEMRYDAKNKRYNNIRAISYLRVDFDYVDKLFDFCNQQKPFISKNSYSAMPPVGQATAPSMNTTQQNNTTAYNTAMSDIEPK